MDQSTPRLPEKTSPNSPIASAQVSSQITVSYIPLPPLIQVYRMVAYDNNVNPPITAINKYAP